MTDKQWENYEIGNGPSKFDLSVALFRREPVSFTLQSGSKVVVTINRVQAEDGSAESWNIDGFVNGQEGREFRAYWHTGRSHGHMKLEHRSRVRVVSAS